ncbi:hypothetical protein [Circoviridae 6 LDMD-2013]|uniref:hypothetical protein n=1 Tax=Circoviridae 6 LDMD-2013 TaxID=1379710 RepID=UPI000384629C|nr:hypothetical protein [Circoviridae 6 LDMD-2013]AGS36193.1 hypothetical protein [Circoviridae 6 LDMD-2013]
MPLRRRPVAMRAPRPSLTAMRALGIPLRAAPYVARAAGAVPGIAVAGLANLYQSYRATEDHMARTLKRGRSTYGGGSSAKKYKKPNGSRWRPGARNWTSRRKVAAKLSAVETKISPLFRREDVAATPFPTPDTGNVVKTGQDLLTAAHFVIGSGLPAAKLQWYTGVESTATSITHSLGGMFFPPAQHTTGTDEVPSYADRMIRNGRSIYLRRTSIAVHITCPTVQASGNLELNEAGPFRVRMIVYRVRLATTQSEDAEERDTGKDFFIDPMGRPWGWKGFDDQVKQPDTHLPRITGYDVMSQPVNSNKYQVIKDVKFSMQPKMSISAAESDTTGQWLVNTPKRAPHTKYFNIQLPWGRKAHFTNTITGAQEDTLALRHAAMMQESCDFSPILKSIDLSAAEPDDFNWRTHIVFFGGPQRGAGRFTGTWEPAITIRGMTRAYDA